LQDIQVIQGCEEFSLGSGPVGALLVHGLTGSPQGMRGLGEYLSEREIAVVGPRLPGHGTTWQDLATRRQEEWTECVDKAFALLAAESDEVFLVGLSFGAALCLDLAARYPDRVSGVVALAPYVISKDPRRYLAPLIRRLISSLPGVGSDIADPDMKEIVYERVPTAAAHQMLGSIKRIQRSLAKVQCPLLVIHSPNDHTAHPDNARYIHDRVSSEDKEVVWLERSYHVITLDYERDEVFERTHRFIKEHAGGV
jgi:carboxylesterase